MPYFDSTYTSGVIATREKFLLKEKIVRLCELSAEEGFRVLLESGFGGGAENVTNMYEYETLIAAEEERVDEFIRQYAPNEALQAYLLSSRDFHNAKALTKAAYLGVSSQRLLAPMGLIPVDELSVFVENGDFEGLKARNAFLGEACEEARKLLEENPSGSALGAIFEKAAYRYLWKMSKGNSVLKKLLTAKADMTNILTALRSDSAEEASGKYLPVGKLQESELAVLFEQDADKIKAAFAKTPYAEFVSLCLLDKQRGLPMTEAEKIVGGYDVSYFSKRKYELEKSEPFLYYVYRRRIENANVRIVFACLFAGLNEHEIKKRLRAF